MGIGALNFRSAPGKEYGSVMNIKERVAQLDWREIEESLWGRGYARTPFLTADECDELVALYDDEKRFQSRVDLSRYRVGSGEFKTFANPLPEIVKELSTHAYPHLAAIANHWMQALGFANSYPGDHQTFLNYCRQHGQTEPTPALLKHASGGYNTLHQDIFGEIYFPLQLVAFLSRRGSSYTGGELMFIEKGHASQLKGEVILPEQGEIVFFTTQYRPISGAQGYDRVKVWHGVSTVHSGLRFSLGVSFHNAPPNRD
jgi:hypothetical protein